MKIPIRLFESNATNFNTCKNVMNECISAVMTENIDGNFYIEIDYPMFDEKGIGKLIDRGLIVKCSTYDNRPDQLFKIRKRNRSTGDKKVSLYAECIARAELDSNIILGVEVPAGKTRKEAIGIALNAIQDKRRIYNVGTKDTNTNTSINMGLDDNGNVINYLDIAYINPLKALLDESENSIYKAYGGEIEFNNFEINMLDERGKDNKFTIRSGKNLKNLEEEISDMGDDFATALIMCSSDGLYLPNNEILYSTYASQYDRYFYKVIKCDDVSLEDLTTENSTDADIENAKNIVYEQLRERGQKYFNALNDRLFGNYTINFVELAKSEEYKDYAKLTKCALGNTVKTIYPAIGLSVENRVTEIKYNILTDNIEEITVGKPITHNIADTINNTSNVANNVKDEVLKTKTNLKKTEKELKKSDKEIKVTMEASDEAIKLSVANEVVNREAAINVLDGKIDLSVKNLREDTEASITILEDEIELKVDEDDFGTLIEQNSRHVTIAVHDGTDMLVTFDSDGQTIDDGALKINNDGDTVFYFNSDGTACVKDIYFINGGDEADGFIQAISEPRTIWVNDISGDDAEFDNLDVRDSKNCIIDTKNYGIRRINAYETAEYYFGDIGFGTIKDGLCIITIDEIFKECVNTSIDYHVFIQTYNGSNVRIEKYEDYFIAYGSENTEFSWEIKAKRIGYENVRLEQKGLVDEARQKVNTSTIVNNYINNSSNIVTTDLISRNNEIENDLLEVIGL